MSLLSAEEDHGALTFSTCVAGGIRFEVSQESNRYKCDVWWYSFVVKQSNN